MNNNILRLDTYTDERFSKLALNQHGCYIINGNIPCEVTIMSIDSAHVKAPKEHYDELIKSFRFNSGHITKFYTEDGELIKEYESVKIFKIDLDKIQPMQFFIDEEKLASVKTFVHSEEDIIIPLTQYDGSYASLDGHTRLYLAYKLGFTYVYGYIEEAFEGVDFFVEETKKRRIFSAKDMMVLTHNEYDEKWNKFCDEYYEELEKNK